MKYKLISLFVLGILLLGTQSAWAADADKEADTLPSPYFIDGLHCEGLPQSKRVVTWFASDEEVEIAKRVASQEDCEATLSVYGVSKFSWLTPEDLEKLSDTLKRSHLFKTVEVSIKKSEIKNHIHLFAKLDRYPTERRTLENSFTATGAKNADSSRFTNATRFQYDNFEQAPLGSYKFGTYVEHSSATGPLLGQSPAQFDNSQYPFLMDFYVGSTRHLFLNTHLDTEVHLIAMHDVLSNSVDGRGYGIVTWRFPTRISFLSGESYIAPGLLITESQLYPGGRLGWTYGSPEASHATFDFTFFAKSGGIALLDYDLKYRYMANTLGIEGVFGTISLQFRLSDPNVAPIDTLTPFSATDRQTLEFSVGKKFRLWDSPTEVSFRYGDENLRGLTNRESASTQFTGLGMVFRGEMWDVKLKATYQFDRMF
ncbi:MAG: hypothetical protein HYR96_05880 [Deltaproteobacteria bacterium]|nr:hypothetical protein [Deltaproteobacteria bacterium]MBI3295787.1 hypothetical protein [Deltaproteobacteria bacterium]